MLIRGYRDTLIDLSFVFVFCLVFCFVYACNSFYVNSRILYILECLLYLLKRLFFGEKDSIFTKYMISNKSTHRGSAESLAFPSC